MAGGGGDQETNLEYTPTWVVVVYLLKKKQKPLYEALQKIRQELMLLGFISLLLTVSQDRILKICISKHLTNHWLPCKKDNDAKETVHFLTNFFSLVLGGRCLLVGSANSGYCGAKDKAPLLSLTALHHLHTFIFVLAISHVTFSALTILFEGLKIRQWKSWEEYNPEEVLRSKVTHVQDHDFSKSRFLGFAFFRQAILWICHKIGLYNFEAWLHYAGICGFLWSCSYCLMFTAGTHTFG
ncbi:MLO-like protein 15 isoform X1 [Capsicum annuum]|uniref:MLO-like protein 15 isoform X1 n=1 Tax=Capsicum annuum TaxID=4072 RepID=UPI0007BFAB84|nr:MLO-like protein 15 isoform X1 [Capsicum annuum]